MDSEVAYCERSCPFYRESSGSLPNLCTAFPDENLSEPMKYDAIYDLRGRCRHEMSRRQIVLLSGRRRLEQLTLKIDSVASSLMNAINSESSEGESNANDEMIRLLKEREDIFEEFPEIAPK